MHSLQRGQRVPLTQMVGAATHLTLRVHLPGLNAPDISVFGLDAERRLSDDRYFVFYNQPASPERAIVLNSPAGSFRVDLDRVPVQVHRLLLAATSDDQPFSALGGGRVTLEADPHTGLTFELSGTLFDQEQAVMLLEVYRHQGEWRVSAVAQGFAGGLQALLESLGGEVAGEPDGASGAPAASLAPTSEPSPATDVWVPLTGAAQPGAAPQTGAHTCRRCGKTPNLFSRGRLDTRGWCRTCVQQEQEALGHFRTRFLAACADGIMEAHEWQDLQATVTRSGLDARRALEFVRSDALHLLERTAALARADGVITDQELEAFERLARLLDVPASMLSRLRADLQELRLAASIRAGHLPVIQTTLILDAAEVAHLEIPATFRHVTATRTRDIPGRLILTSRQLHFVSGEGGWNVQYGKVLRIEELPDGVNLELGVRKGSGVYHGVPSPVLLGASLDALVRLHKRLMLTPQTEKASRSIPQAVKLQVWQRDQGRCVQCNDSNYLEYDHVIPFSLGGASTLNNLQLLCRRCNLQKSNRL
ncbi:TerF-like protein [Deinococcus seoulensis]|uniref:TerF-like protein n=1 Tax=Deinococcus seoulensis TaxID=1837379 RepID=A0ABQ2RRL9_9DEIO|nr:TerD family protein [Deinococcus seoulensis]GGR60609.1 TerF-like protein [Deinococcus seoulensis]